MLKKIRNGCTKMVEVKEQILIILRYFIKELQQLPQQISIYYFKGGRNLKQMIDSEEIVIVPAGFRCFTKDYIAKTLGIRQHSFPFDSGFFPPTAIARIIKNPNIYLHYPDENTTHSVCVKYENYNDSKLGLGIKFQKSSYDEINSKVISKDVEEINKYLDSTYGYYTLDVNHGLVLAHYNWHKFASQFISKGMYDPAMNLKAINEILNRRVQRFFKLCNSAKYIVFVVMENQEYNYMMIDEDYYDLHDYSELIDAAKSTFNGQCFVVKAIDFDSPQKLLKMLNIC